MYFLIELGVAFKAAAQILVRRQFWAALAKATLTLPLLLVLAGLAAVYLTVNPERLLWVGHEASLAAYAGAWLLLPPVLMHAWCPPIAHAVNASLRLGLPERRQYKLWLFIVLWLGLALLQGMVSFVALSFSRDVALWGILVPAILLSGAYLQRAALGTHAGLKISRALFRATFLRRNLVWVPLLALALFFSARAGMALKRLLIGPYHDGATSSVFDLALIVLQLPVVAALLTLWAALVLPALGQLLVARGELPGSQREVSSRPAFPVSGRKMALFAVLLLAVVGAYIERLWLLDTYLAFSDQEYAAENSRMRSLRFYERMQIVECQAAGKGQVGRMELLRKFGHRMGEESLTDALDCAVGNNQLEAVKYLIGRGAPVEGIAFRQRSRPIWRAVHEGHLEMVQLLLGLGADPNTPKIWRSSKETNLLNAAAEKKDVAMLRFLREAGTKPFADGRQPAFLFAEASLSRQEDVATDWPAVISAMEEAGISLDAKDGDGSNMLHWAAGHGQFGLIAILLKRGIDPTQPDQHGELPFLRLADWYQREKVEPGPELELALALLTEGVADINVPAVPEPNHRNLASIAAVKPRVRQAFAGRIRY